MMTSGVSSRRYLRAASSSDAGAAPRLSAGGSAEEGHVYLAVFLAGACQHVGLHGRAAVAADNGIALGDHGAALGGSSVLFRLRNDFNQGGLGSTQPHLVAHYLILDRVFKRRLKHRRDLAAFHKAHLNHALAKRSVSKYLDHHAGLPRLQVRKTHCVHYVQFTRWLSGTLFAPGRTRVPFFF